MKCLIPLFFFFLTSFCCGSSPQSEPPLEKPAKKEVALDTTQDPEFEWELISEDMRDGVLYQRYSLEGNEMGLIQKPKGKLLQFYKNFYISPSISTTIVSREAISSEKQDFLRKKIGEAFLLWGEVFTFTGKKPLLKEGIDILDLFFDKEPIDGCIFDELTNATQFRNEVFWLDSTFVRCIVNPTGDSIQIMPGFFNKSRYSICPLEKLKNEGRSFLKSKLGSYSYFSGMINGQVPFFLLEDFNL